MRDPRLNEGFQEVGGNSSLKTILFEKKWEFKKKLKCRVYSKSEPRTNSGKPKGTTVEKN